MGTDTKIEWADRTWSPWEGCQKVGPGCDHCYAEAMNRWLRKAANWGPGAPRREYSDAHWEKPLRWNAEAQRAGKQIKVFPSVCDPFDNAVPRAWRDRFFDLIASTPHLTWLLLTKRIGNARSMLPATWVVGATKPWPNVWLGATVVNQEEADRDIPKLVATPAAKRFLSIEPMLGPVDLTAIQRNDPEHPHPPNHDLADLDWVICGGESGHGARPMHPDWARALRDQCVATGVAFFFKQHGEWAPGSGLNRALRTAAVAHDGSVAPGGHSVTDYPRGATSADGWSMVHWAGKRGAGRLLDGREWNEVPQ